MRRLEYFFAISCLFSLLASSCAQSEPGTAAQIRNAAANVSNDRQSPTPDNSNTANPTIPTAKKAVRPSMISRKDWRAAEPVGTGIAHSIRFITIHHTAELQKMDVAIEDKMRNLQKFSQSVSKLASGKAKPAWFDVPYHFYISVDGKIAEGRELKYAGDTNTDYDPSGHALIVLEGNFEEEQPTAEQLKSLRAMVAWISVESKVPASEIKAHDDYASTACPGKSLKALLPQLREELIGVGPDRK